MTSAGRTSGGTATRVAVVTDSTSCLPPALARQHQITVVPLDVVVDGERYLDGPELGADRLVVALRRGAKVTTSQPPPAAFVAAYERAAADGATQLVSVHLSGELSGTVRAARLAAAAVPVPVRVVDSRSVGLGLGFAVLAAARLASPAPDEPDKPSHRPGTTDRFGALRDLPRRAVRPRRAARRRDDEVPPPPGPDEVAARATEVARTARVHFLVDSLEHLRRGGRLSAAGAALGTVLQLRPLLALHDGRVTTAEKVRTREAARRRLEQVARADLAGRPAVALGVQHLGRPDEAAALLDALVLAAPGSVRDALVAEAGVVLGAHAGPGLLAVVVANA